MWRYAEPILLLECINPSKLLYYDLIINLLYLIYSFLIHRCFHGLIEYYLLG